MEQEKGFTLIELLVVVAIVGILSAITLGYLQTTRLKGRDASIMANLSQARSKAELFYTNNNGTYIGICDSGSIDYIGSNVQSALDASLKPAAYDTVAETCFVNAAGTDWAAAVPLTLNSSSYFCVDSAGAAVKVSSYPISSSDVSCTQ